MENSTVVAQIKENAPEQIMLGDFPAAVQDAVMDSLESYNGMASQVLSNKKIAEKFSRLLLDWMISEPRGTSGSAI